MATKLAYKPANIKYKRYNVWLQMKSKIAADRVLKRFSRKIRKEDAVKDVPDGGVLFALPALLLLGLLSKSREMFSMPEGFYPLESIFLVLALMALARIPSLEALRYESPGEWGKLMGLDRIPEVRTLREKITELCAEQGRAQRWSTALAKQWMAEEPESAGIFYADGHVRIYHGKLTQLPHRYVAREKLRLRGTTDYWVNAMD